MSKLRVRYQHPFTHLEGPLRLPASKSISNRVLIIHALCTDSFKIANLSAANDTRILQNALQQIQSSVQKQCINVEDAGTAFRFLTAYLSQIDQGEFLLSGSGRMHQRPIAALVNTLRSMGADITYAEQTGYPPLLIKGRSLGGGVVSVDAHESSQFASALCLIAPSLPQGLSIDLGQEIVSYRYIVMTLRLMEVFGIHYALTHNQIQIPAQAYRANDFLVENDWSSISFFYAYAMLTDETELRFTHLLPDSFQGDAYIQEIASHFGIESYFEGDIFCIRKYKLIRPIEARTYDMTNYPDLAIPLIVACAIRFPQIQFSGIDHLQYKESNRLQALSDELQKFGLSFTYAQGLLTFSTAQPINPSETIFVHTYADHRIAMNLSLFALAGYTLVLDDAACVSKSFPGYFDELSRIGFSCEVV